MKADVRFGLCTPTRPARACVPPPSAEAPLRSDAARAAANDTFYARPMTLTKFGLPDWRPGMGYAGAAESPAQHRYPVWWTGDGVDLQASVESMVDGGVHGFKPFVHSDCGGDWRGSAGSLLRWTGHCVFGSILRFHGSDHRPWTYTPAVERRAHAPC